MSYEPTHPGEGVTSEWIYQELLRISSEMPKVSVQQFEVLTIEPARPQVGMAAYADGTDWNPGAGEGLYEYRSDLAWHKL